MREWFGTIVFLLLLLLFGSGHCDALPAPVVTDLNPKIRMCKEAAAPDAAPDKLHIHCGLEYGRFAPEKHPNAQPVKELLVVAYNMERGMQIDGQIRLLKTHPMFQGADILLLSELDRGCSRTGGRNTARDIAEALEMDYVYGVEYIELPRKSDKSVNSIDTLCEHGNALLSRHPILGIEEIRHRRSKNWYLPPGAGRDNREPRLGGNMAIAADIDLNGATIRAYAIHLEGDLENADIRAEEAAELVAHAASVSGPTVMGGDCNTYLYINDLQTGGRTDSATPVLFDAGFEDAHKSLPTGKRGTTDKTYGLRAVIDLMFVRGARVAGSGICPGKICDPLSDHLPIWAKISIN